MEAITTGNLGHGGAIGAVADSFNNYGWFLPIYWAILGWLVAAVYYRAIYQNSLRWKLHYIGILCASHWLIAQSLAEASVPGIFYQVSYFLAFKFALIPKTFPRRKIEFRGRNQIINESPKTVS
jgi:hypothetical protein